MKELDNRFKPLTRDDFHPWKDMMGADWDNEHRFDGWGAGEWCEHLPPGVELRANRKSVSRTYHLFEVTFVWESTKETIRLPLGCLQGGFWGSGVEFSFRGTAPHSGLRRGRGPFSSTDGLP